MPPADVAAKEAIQKALSRFSDGNLADNARALFNALDYRSDKTVDLGSSAPRDFIATFDRNGRFSPSQALYDEWTSAELVFQLTDAEVAQGEQRSLWAAERRVDDKIIELYLLLAIGLRRDAYTRTDLASITRAVNRLFDMPALILFHHGTSLTLSVIDRRLHRRDESKDVLEKVTLIKDIAFARPHRAHIEILFDLSLDQLRTQHTLHNWVDLHDAWRKTLDTSLLNKRFFKEIANWYFWAQDLVTFPPCAGKPAEECNAAGLIRLITRLIFVWFVKEKDLVPDALFDRRFVDGLLRYDDPQHSTYYKAILQNLFFGTLNTEMGARAFRHQPRQAGGRSDDYLAANRYRYERYFKQPQAFVQQCETVPFLNGGLFECLDRRADERADGFSDRTDNPLRVPDELFFNDGHDVDLNAVYGTRNKRYRVRGLLDILANYKFTVDENTPVEEEIALDPELLGKVFENLLAAYNPETGVTARKQTGSFYTPREIVNYMVDESLVAFFETRLADGNPAPDLTARLRALLAYRDEPHGFTEDEVDRLVAAIDSLKALDPACGSGAFPMGLLHKLVHVLRRLDPDNRRWRARQTARAEALADPDERTAARADFEDAFANDADYARKLYLIENCLYGVDIQPIAVQIAKLRCFISLVVDDSVDETQPNRGIRPLPNLETKFVAANSLIGIERPPQMAFRNPDIEAAEKELEAVRRRHFSARTTRTKARCRERDAQLRAELGELLRQGGFAPATVARLAAWDPYDQQTAAGFFDPEWMFDVNDGFDIVIGNPPYLESRHPSFSSDLKDELQRAVRHRWGDDASLVTRGADLLIYFFELSLYVLRERGNVVLITQNSWLDTEYGKKFQTFLLHHTHVRGIIDSDYKQFDSVGGPNINTVISLFAGKHRPAERSVVTFARYHVSFDEADGSVFCARTGSHAFADTRRYRYSDSAIDTVKWGILLTAPEEYFHLLTVLTSKARAIGEIKEHRLTIGQGLNLTSSHFVETKTARELGIPSTAQIPIFTSADGAPFDLTSTQCVLVQRGKLSCEDTKRLQRHGYETFDSESTRKCQPVLIMPRGLGRHFCLLNTCRAFSASGVDVYDLQGSITDEMRLNLWLSLNSSVCWLWREVSGRKNLGGGMLKAEAVDLEPLPIYMDFNSVRDVEAVFSRLRQREALEAAAEIDTAEHQRIDHMVAEYLGLTTAENQKFRELLKAQIIDRTNKART